MQFRETKKQVYVSLVSIRVRTNCKNYTEVWISYMGSFVMSCVDLERGGGLHSSAVTDNDEESTCFSEGSCYSPSYSTANSSIHGSNFDSESDQVLDSRRISSVVGSDCIVGIDYGVPEHIISMGTVQEECRICNLSLQDTESGIAIELGCSCKDDLAAAHQHCADTWFKIKGNNICEICHSIAQNVVIPIDIESRQQTGVVTFTRNAVSVPLSTLETNDIESTQQISTVSNSTTNAVAVQASSNFKNWDPLEFIIIGLVVFGVLLYITFT